MAKTARFYGWTHAEIANLSYDDFITYYKAIDTIEAQETLIAMRVGDYPKISESERAKVHSEIYRKAYPKERKILTTKDFAKELGMVKNG